MRRLPRLPFGRTEPTCKRVGKVLQTYLDGELDERDLDQVEKHLDACRDCGLELDIYNDLKQRLSGRRRSIDPEVLQRLRAFGAGLTGRDDQRN